MTSPATFLLRQYCHASFRALQAEQSAIMFVRNGIKRVRADAGQVDIAAGHLGVLPARRPMTVENCPPEQGCYVAQALTVPDEVLHRARQDGLAHGDPFRTTGHDRALAAFDQAAIRLDDPLTPPRLRDHAVREVLLWLAEDGVGFGKPEAPSFADRLRSLLSANPDQPWRSIDAARALAVSEATLRRRLGTQGTSFQDVLIDVRMTWALGLLQTSTLSVTRIALDVGYASPSRFAVRFRARFGIAPSDIRQMARQDQSDRIGTRTDRLRTALTHPPR